MFSIFTFVFIAALQHIKLHLFERGQPASTITENSKHRVGYNSEGRKTDG